MAIAIALKSLKMPVNQSKMSIISQTHPQTISFSMTFLMVCLWTSNSFCELQTSKRRFNGNCHCTKITQNTRKSVKNEHRFPEIPPNHFFFDDLSNGVPTNLEHLLGATGEKTRVVHWQLPLKVANRPRGQNFGRNQKILSEPVFGRCGHSITPSMSP